MRFRTLPNFKNPLMLENIIRFMFDNIGNPVSATKISNALTQSGNKISVNTVEAYLQTLVDSFILYKVQRYDIKGKQYLVNGGKHYLRDVGLRYYLLGTKKADRGHILENVVYLELIILFQIKMVASKLPPAALPQGK